MSDLSSSDFDVIVIGAGVIGLSIAREILRTRPLRILIVEREEDVGRGASGRNSGVVHPGFSVAPGSLKARLNVEGARLLRPLSEELGVPLREVGTLVVASSPGDLPKLEDMLEAGKANGLTELEIVDRGRLRGLEPQVTGEAALFCPGAAIIDPHALVFRLADSAREAGAEFSLNTQVLDLERKDDHWHLSTDRGETSCQTVVNAAGVSAVEISRKAGGEVYESFPCKGEYLVLDRLARGVPSRMVYPLPPETGGLGVHFTPTIAGNTLIGPSAEYVETGEFATTGSVLSTLFEEARRLCAAIDRRDVITTFAGVRAKMSQGSYGQSDFVVQESDLAPGLINLIGIESPGLTASPAIARFAAQLVLADRPAARTDLNTREMLPASDLASESSRKAFLADRRAHRRFFDLDPKEKAAAAESDPDSRQIVCRCEQVTRAEVLAALNNPEAARSLTAIKTRCRAGMGRCQGSFCGPRVMKILREEFDLAPEEITLRGPGSEMLSGESKEPQA